MTDRETLDRARMLFVGATQGDMIAREVIAIAEERAQTIACEVEHSRRLEDQLKDLQHSLVCSYLRVLNPDASEAEIGIYADYMRSYSTATANIREHGEIVQHPRTAAPITNPYLDVRDSAVKMLRTIKLQTGKLTASPLFAVCLMDGDDKPDSPDDFFGCPGKTAREAVDEAMELFEGDKIAHVIAPNGQATTIDLLA